MYVIKGKNKSGAVLNVQNVNLTPKVNSKKTFIDQFGNSDAILNITFYCNIDIATLEKSPFYDNINFKLSKNSLNAYRSLAKASTVDSVVKSQILQESILPPNKPPPAPGSTISVNYSNHNVAATSNTSDGLLNPSQLNGTINGIASNRLNRSMFMYNDTKNIGSVSLSNYRYKNETEKVIELREKSNRSNRERNKRQSHVPGLNLTNKGSTNRTGEIQEIKSMFQKTYFAMLEANQDPAVMFQNSYNKSSLQLKKKGIESITKSKKKSHNAKFLDVIRNIIERIPPTDRYSIVETEVLKSSINIPITININLSNLRALGNVFYVLLMAKNNRGVNLEAIDYPVNFSNILRQLEPSAYNFSLDCTRTNSGVSVVKIKNNDNYGKINVSLEAKPIKRLLPNALYTYKRLNEFQVLPKTEFIIRDGKSKNKTRTPQLFDYNDSIYYRSLLNFGRKRYHNCKSVVDSSKKIVQENIPFCTVIAKNVLNQNEQGILIKVTNIGSNVIAVRPRKYAFKGSSKGKLNYVLDNEKKKIGFARVEKNGTNASFIDRNVKEKRVYQYVVECKMTNGEIKIAPGSFIVKNEKRTGTIEIKDIKLETKQLAIEDTNADGGLSFNSQEGNNRSVNISFKIIKVKNEIDKILENMFGNLFDLFSDKLKTVADMSALIYSIEIVRINEFTGEAITIGKVTPDNEGNCTFFDAKAPSMQSSTYQFIPRVMLAREAIDAVNSQIEYMSKKLKSSTINYSIVSKDIKEDNKRKNIFSSVGSKNYKKQAFVKGVIESDKLTLDRQNFDIFLDSSTGDIYEKRLIAYNPLKLPGDAISISNARIKEVQKNIQDIHNDASKSTINERFFDLTFSIGGDVYVDFYTIFISEGNISYLDGTMHSTDIISPNKKYSYLARHRGSLGLIQYHIVPFYKNGTVGEPKLIIANVITN